LALRALAGRHVLDHQVEGALSPAPKVLALLAAEARLPGHARVAGAAHAAMDVADDGGRGIRQLPYAVPRPAWRVGHRLQGRTQETAMAAGGLVALHLAAVGPAAHRVRSDADQSRRRPDGQPGVVGVRGLRSAA